MTATRKLLIALVVLALAGAAAGFYYLQNREKPDATARAYLAAWEEADYPAMQALALSAPARFAEIYEGIPDDMAATDYSFELGDVTSEGDSAVAPFTATWSLEGLGDFKYDTILDLERQEDTWKVVWSPESVHPDFTVNSSFERTRTWPQRGQLLGFDGKAITEERRVVVVGIEPRRIQDRAAMVQVLVDQLQVDPAKVNADLSQPGLRGDWFLAVKEISAEEYEAKRPILYPVPGLVFQNQQKRLPPTPEFARHILGSVGEVTAEGLEQLGEPYRAGDRVGRSGLEASFEKQLAGEPAMELRITTADGSNNKVLLSNDGKPAQDVETTLAVPVQNAAEAALAGVENPAAIVVVEIATSQVRAAVSRPINEFNRAFGGRYPPGSSFKVVSAGTLLGSGVTPEQRVACPATVNVGGRSFRNFEGEALGQTDFRQVFVHSCNTGFIDLTRPIEQGTLTRGAETFGFNSDYDFPLNAAGGSYPEPRDATEKAAATIGQGRVLASPLHMATVAGAAAGGGWRPPTLTADAAQPERLAMEAAVGENLRELMTGVVDEGTGTAARVPGKPVAGKTGTAEFGNDRPPKTHAWFIGFSGEYAFAVLVVGGGVGGLVAAPIAAKLVAGL
ncbi:MAG TPA: penicillin-binding transpeptidase domain-containing protein [Actinomycetota bacterium]|nr:penicillin-binding transpeptidase domain-containing protein [Actinomycetota bacterium]